MIELRRSENLLPVEELFGGTKRPASAPRSEEPDTPDIRNQDAVLALLAYRALKFRGRTFLVPPISWTDGLQLQRLQFRLIDVMKEATITPALFEQYAATVAELTRIARRLLVPMGWRRWLWRAHIRPDRLRGATEQEIGWVLDFLLKCRTTAPVRLQNVEVRHPALT